MTGIRSDIEAEKARLREAVADDHPYGAWGGGSKAQGGRPMGGGGGGDAGAEAKAYMARTFDLPAAKQRVDKQNEKLPKPLQQGARIKQGEPNSSPYMQAEYKREATAETKRLKDDLGFTQTQIDGPPNTTFVSMKNEGGLGLTQVMYRGDDGQLTGMVTMSKRSVKGKEVMQIDNVRIFAGRRGEGHGTKMYDAIQDSGQVNLYAVIGQSQAFSPKGALFAKSWLEHRIAKEAS
jgi:hypothetical protein